MGTTVIVCLSGIALAAAALAGLNLLLARSAKGKNAAAKTETEKDGALCQQVEVGGQKAGAYYYPAPEELEESVPCLDSTDSCPLDNGPSDIETAVRGSCRGEALPQAIASLMRSGMMVVDSDGKELSPEDILSLRDDDKAAVPHERRTSRSAADPATKKRSRRRADKPGGAPDRLDNELKRKDTKA